MNNYPQRKLSPKIDAHEYTEYVSSIMVIKASRARENKLANSYRFASDLLRCDLDTNQFGFPSKEVHSSDACTPASAHIRTSFLVSSCGLPLQSTSITKGIPLGLGYAD